MKDRQKTLYVCTLERAHGVRARFYTAPSQSATAQFIRASVTSTGGVATRRPFSDIYPIRTGLRIRLKTIRSPGQLKNLGTHDRGQSWNGTMSALV